MWHERWKSLNLAFCWRCGYFQPVSCKSHYAMTGIYGLIIEDIRPKKDIKRLKMLWMSVQGLPLFQKEKCTMTVWDIGGLWTLVSVMTVRQPDNWRHVLWRLHLLHVVDILSTGMRSHSSVHWCDICFLSLTDRPGLKTITFKKLNIY